MLGSYNKALTLGRMSLLFGKVHAKDSVTSTMKSHIVVKKVSVISILTYMCKQIFIERVTY